MNDGNVTIPSQSTKICDWRVEEKPEECHIHPWVARHWVFVAKITGWKNGYADNKVGYCQGKDEPVGRGTKAATFGDKKYYEAVSCCCYDWKCPAEWAEETFHVVPVCFLERPILAYLLIRFCSVSQCCFGNSRKMFGNVRVAFGTILENLRKSPESGRKSLENREKRRHQ